MHLLNCLAHEPSGKPVGKYPSEEEDRLRPGVASNNSGKLQRLKARDSLALIKAVVGMKEDHRMRQSRFQIWGKELQMVKVLALPCRQRSPNSGLDDCGYAPRRWWIML